MHDQDLRIVTAVFELLHARVEGATICPSEVARALQPDNWRHLMPAVREVASRLATEHRIDVRQRGRVIQLTAETRGPVRLSLRRDVR